MNTGYTPDSPEQWRTVVGFPDYQVSNLGRVISHRRPTAKILNPRVRPNGYLAVGLRNDPKAFNPTTMLVHRLVLAAFVGPCPEGMECCHNNGDPADNRVDNLRWDTPSANARDCVRHGTHPYAGRTHCNNGHEFNETNTVIRPTGARRCRICRNESASAHRTRNAFRAAGIAA